MSTLHGVRHHGLGRSIEDLESKMPTLEELFVRLRDTDSKAAEVVEAALKEIDYVLAFYEEVR